VRGLTDTSVRALPPTWTEMSRSKTKCRHAKLSGESADPLSVAIRGHYLYGPVFAPTGNRHVELQHSRPDTMGCAFRTRKDMRVIGNV